MAAPRYPDAKFLGAAVHSNGKFAKGYPIGIIEHYTAGGDGRATAKMLQGDNDRRVSVHFTIDRDGTIYQCAELDQRCNHAGLSSWKGLSLLNGYYIGIENANYGFMRKVGNKFMLAAVDYKVAWKPSNGQKVDQVIFAPFKYRPDGEKFYWEPFTAPQIESNVALIRWLLETLPTIKYIIGHDDASPERKQDPGPAFPLQKMIDLLHPDSENEPPSFTVKAPTPLNVRGGPGVQFDTLSIGPIENGTKVKVLRDEGAWSYISFAKGEGWVFDKYLV